MKEYKDFENVQATDGGSSRLPAGGYICRITEVVDTPIDEKTGKGDYLKIEYDIAEGEYKNYYADKYERFGDFWGGRFIRSYKEKAIGMFKHFINCVTESNAGYSWNWNEATLIGKCVGLVFGEEEYQNQNGEIKTRLYVKDIKTVEQIKKGDYKTPELKKLPQTSAAPMTELSADDDLPF